MRDYDFGDRAQGRVVDDTDDFRVTRPAKFAAGIVTGLFPMAPKYVVVTTSAGDQFTIRAQDIR